MQADVAKKLEGFGKIQYLIPVYIRVALFPSGYSGNGLRFPGIFRP